MKKKLIIYCLVGFFVIVPLLIGIYQYAKPLPDNISYEGAVYEADVEFIYDVTYEKDGERVTEQQLQR